jgi:nucleoid DNA-binding protein
MRIRKVLLAVVALPVVLSAGGETKVQAQSPGVRQLTEVLMERTGLSDRDVITFLNVLGPSIGEQISQGRMIYIPGLGSFRTVLIPPHRDLVYGRPVTVPAINWVEFLPAENVVLSANSPYAVPHVVVPAFQYVPIPNRVQSLKTPRTRVPNVRTR